MHPFLSTYMARDDVKRIGDRPNMGKAYSTVIQRSPIKAAILIA